MPKQRFTTEEMIHKLREADVWIGQGKTIAEVCKMICTCNEIIPRLQE